MSLGAADCFVNGRLSVSDSAAVGTIQDMNESPEEAAISLMLHI
jgi:hypothetical protein